MYNKKEVYMDKINSTNINRRNFEGKNKVMSGQVNNSIEKNIDNLVSGLKKKVREKFVDHNIYPPEKISSEFQIDTKDTVIKKVELAVEPLHPSLKERKPDFDKLRNLTLYAYGSRGERVHVDLTQGGRQDIFDYLQNPENKKNLLELFNEFDITLRAD